ncbi:sodium-dependent transporter [Bilifractor sp. LCP21S3_A7]|jgi:NSS family neurotransmitter:Na+ symporter|uniref:sodium-dependent transporter n=1 Tax=Bilifractor sp. LCP21S3_A7 TaxID=3438738 RepID=UPI003F8E8661
MTAQSDRNRSGKKKSKTGSFSGQLGFVMAAAGSAVGVGNLWRFPYLAAKDGGGLFIIIYLCLVLTFGFTLLTSDIAIGRKTRKSSIYAYASMRPRWKFLGIITFFVPVLIMTYYAVIGGWISRYIVVYFTGAQKAAAGDSFFTSFITSPVSPVFFALLFMAVTSIIVYKGVEGGIEMVSKWMMPILLVLIVAIAIFSLTLRHTDENGVTRTGIQGLLVYLTPNLSGLTLGRFLQILLDAMSQLFFSLSVSMGIMITYGSYVKPDVNLNRSVNQIEIFDTGVALLAGMMIIPSIYVFSGTDGMSAGTSLMFVSLPKVFYAMGAPGIFIGAMFFIMAAFATLTSCISVLEAIVANCMELFHASRKKITVILTIIYMAASAVIALGYSIFYVEVRLPNGSVGQLLDIMDYISNSFMMPFISLLSTILIGWVIGPKWIIDEMESSGDRFTRKKLYVIMIKYVAPVMMFILFLQSTGLLNAIA